MNTQSVIKWFTNLENKSKLSFIQFDVCDFYPSITEPLLIRALRYARNFEAITAEESKIILQTKKAFVFRNGVPWVKKGNKNFDVTMGSFDGAEICELVGIYLLSQLTGLKLNLGLYRDDGLAVTDLKPRQAELEKKKVCQIFKENGLRITIEANVESVNFLDINMNLKTGLYKPYIKPNETPLYVHAQSNHPPAILKNIPKSINNRLSSISANKEVFDQACPLYQRALEASGYNFKLSYDPPVEKTKNTDRRKRNITYFNPPYSEHVQTNIGRNFLKLIDKNFPPSHPLSKIINRNTVKISYKCMPNVKKAISRHNQKIQNDQMQEPEPEPGCNCTGKCGPCPLDGNCLVDKVVYRASVTETNGTTNTYTGLTANRFKDRFYGHRSSMENRNPDNQTTLSTHVWGLKDRNLDYRIKWNIIDRANDFNPITRKCRLCLKEKYYIIFQPEGASLNHRSELFSTCRHRLRLTLANTEDFI